MPREFSAGGVLVRRMRGRWFVAAIRPGGKAPGTWALPKGLVGRGERPEDTAVREVAEETGLRARVIAPLGTIDYWFVVDGRRVHKVVHHFLLEPLAGQLSDADVEVSEVAWIPFAELPSRLRYDSERRLLDRAGELLADSA